MLSSLPVLCKPTLLRAGLPHKLWPASSPRHFAHRPVQTAICKPPKSRSQPTLTAAANCALSAINDALENICTLYGYDDAGNQITTNNALNQTNLTVYDGANRPVITVRNLVLSKAENGTVLPPKAKKFPVV
ncbi:MAG: hypothetical protein IT327_20380 [Anaerolineae bacterium]|nr:hypothetical protein [Anaerolineae bacterium]